MSTFRKRPIDHLPPSNGIQHSPSELSSLSSHLPTDAICSRCSELVCTKSDDGDVAGCEGEEEGRDKSRSRHFGVLEWRFVVVCRGFVWLDEAGLEVQRYKFDMRGREKSIDKETRGRERGERPLVPPHLLLSGHSQLSTHLPLQSCVLQPVWRAIHRRIPLFVMEGVITISYAVCPASTLSGA